MYMSKYEYYRDCEGFYEILVFRFISAEFFLFPVLWLLCLANVIVVYVVVKRQEAKWTWTKFYMAVIAVMDILSMIISTFPNFVENEFNYRAHLAWTYSHTVVNFFVYTGNARLFMFVVVGAHQARMRQREASSSERPLVKPGRLNRTCEALFCVLFPSIVNITIAYMMYTRDWPFYWDNRLSFSAISITMQLLFSVLALLLQIKTYIESNKAKRHYEISLYRVRLPNQNEENETQQRIVRDSEMFEFDAEISLAKAIFVNLSIYLIYILAWLFFLGIIPHLTGCLFPYVMAVATELALFNFAINPLVYYKLWPKAGQDIKKCCARTNSEA